MLRKVLANITGVESLDDVKKVLVDIIDTINTSRETENTLVEKLDSLTDTVCEVGDNQVHYIFAKEITGSTSKIQFSLDNIPLDEGGFIGIPSSDYGVAKRIYISVIHENSPRDCGWEAKLYRKLDNECRFQLVDSVNIRT